MRPIIDMLPEEPHDDEFDEFGEFIKSIESNPPSLSLVPAPVQPATHRANYQLDDDPEIKLKKSSGAIQVLSTCVRDTTSANSDISVVFHAYIDNDPRQKFSVLQGVGPVKIGQRWTMCGVWGTHKKWGKQFTANFSTLAEPTTKRELELFLDSGLIEGWGWSHYRSIAGRFPDPVSIVVHEPERLLAITGVTEDMLTTLQHALERGKGMFPIFTQLVEWGLTGKLADRLVLRYNFATIKEMTVNPYQPMLDVSGYGWQKAEMVAGHLGIAPDDPRRMAAAIAQAVSDVCQKEGHTWVERNEALTGARMLLSLPYKQVEKFLDENTVILGIVTEDERIYPEHFYHAEHVIAHQLVSRYVLPPLVPPAALEQLVAPDGLTPDQWRAVLMALSHRVSVLTGSPGVGKSFSLKALIAAALRVNLSVTCMAPTGKAATRMHEATGYPATTIHSCLRIRPGSREFDLPDYLPEHMRVSLPLTGLIIVDEVSMIDTMVMAQVLSRISPAAHILCVGDADQLPSVSPGAVLRDLLRAGILPCVLLDIVFRNAGGIAQNAAHIRRGEPLASFPDCQILEASTQEHAAQLITNLLTLQLPKEGYKLKDVLVLTPIHRGAVGRELLNEQLQTELNAGQANRGWKLPWTWAERGREHIRHQTELRVGDRVIVTKNNPELGVFNGELGFVHAVDSRAVVVQMEDRLVTFTEETRFNLDLAYCITVHKSQGSEAPIVIIPVFRSRMLVRELLYTGLTRARVRVYLVGDPTAIPMAIRQISNEQRRTTLVQYIDSYGNDTVMESETLMLEDAEDTEDDTIFFADDADDAFC